MSDSAPQDTVCLASIMIDVEGDFANRNELKLRQEIEKAIGSLGIGTCVGSGSGMGMMDMDFLIDNSDEAGARTLIEQLMKKDFPDVKYTLDFTLAEGKREDFLPEKSGCGGAATVLILLGISVSVANFVIQNH